VKGDRSVGGYVFWRRPSVAKSREEARQSARRGIQAAISRSRLPPVCGLCRYFGAAELAAAAVTR